MDAASRPPHPWHTEPEPASGRVVKREIASVVRRIAEHVALLDVRRMDEHALSVLVSELGTIERALDDLPSLRAVGGPHFGGPDDRPLVERGPISGVSNALAAPLVMSDVDGGATVRAHAVFGSLYEGPPGMVHGGALLAVFDEVLAFGQVPSGEIGMTGTVTVKLLGGVPIGRRVDFVAGTAGVDGRKATVWARALVGDVVVAEGTAICIRMRRPATSDHG